MLNGVALVFERIGISLAEVYERVGKSFILACKKAQESKQMHFMAVKKLRKCSGFVINYFSHIFN